MAMQFWDGFDHYNNATDFTARKGAVQWWSQGSLLSGTGRNGNGKAWTGTITATMFQRLASHFIGVSADMTANNDVTFTFNDTVANQIQVQVIFRARNYSIELWRGNGNSTTKIYTSANNVWGTNVYNFIEIWPVIDNATGSVTIDVNNVNVLTVTGIDTQNTANAYWDQVSLAGASWDDFYYADTTTGPGSNPCDSFVGDPRVYTLWPTANAAVAFTPKALTNWQEVSEVAMDSDTSYNASSNIGDEDLFTIGSLPTTIVGILGVQVTGAYRKDDAGLRRLKSALKSSATEQYGLANYLADTSYNYFSDIWAIDPATSADWSRAGVNALQIGYNVAA